MRVELKWRLKAKSSAFLWFMQSKFGGKVVEPRGGTDKDPVEYTIRRINGLLGLMEWVESQAGLVRLQRINFLSAMVATKLNTIPRTVVGNEERLEAGRLLAWAGGIKDRVLQLKVG